MNKKNAAIKKTFILFPALVWVLFLPLKIYPQNTVQKLDSVFRLNQLMGMSVVAVCDTSVLSWHFGLSDFTRNITVTDSTLFRIASVSKSITATALMILYDRGLFSLDDDAGMWLGFSLRNPYFPDKPITVRMLLSHTSSIEDGTGYSAFLNDSYSNTPPPVLNQLLTPGGSYYTSDMFSNHEPGSWFSYSNINYAIVGTLVEKISNTRFDQFCTNEIFKPLQITASFLVTDLPNINNLAVLYRYYNNQWVAQADNYQGIMPEPRDLSGYTPGTNALIFAPQGGLRIGAAGLTKFMLMHMNKGIYNNIRILSDSTATLMQQPQWIYNGSNGDYYYGLFRSWSLGFHCTTNQWYGDIVFPFSKMTGHPGEAYGLLSDMYFDRETRTGVIFITNGSKLPYSFGNNSAFYRCEEQVFQIIYNDIALSCNTSLVQSDSRNINISPDLLNEFVEISGLPTGTNYIHIFDITGRLLLKSYTLDEQLSIGTHFLKPGIYLLLIYNGKKQFSYKMVKE